MGGFDVGQLDDVIHGRLRLGIMAYLADAEVADFNELKSALQATQGAVEGRGRAFLRPSGTEPVIRVTVEADDDALMQSTLDALADAVRAAASGAVFSEHASAEKAFVAAQGEAGEGDKIVVFGSFLTVTAVMEHLRAAEARREPSHG